MKEATARHWLFGQRPLITHLYGDKKLKAESAEHIISFPGGAIEVARTTEGDYWAHIIVNRRYVVPGLQSLNGAMGEVVSSRLGVAGRPIVDLPHEPNIEQIAVLIRTGGAPG